MAEDIDFDGEAHEILARENDEEIEVDAQERLGATNPNELECHERDMRGMPCTFFPFPMMHVLVRFRQSGAVASLYVDPFSWLDRVRELYPLALEMRVWVYNVSPGLVPTWSWWSPALADTPVLARQAGV